MIFVKIIATAHAYRWKIWNFHFASHLFSIYTVKSSSYPKKLTGGGKYGSRKRIFELMSSFYIRKYLIGEKKVGGKWLIFWASDQNFPRLNFPPTFQHPSKNFPRLLNSPSKSFPDFWIPRPKLFTDFLIPAQNLLVMEIMMIEPEKLSLY